MQQYCHQCHSQSISACAWSEVNKTMIFFHMQNNCHSMWVTCFTRREPDGSGKYLFVVQNLNLHFSHTLNRCSNNSCGNLSCEGNAMRSTQYVPHTGSYINAVTVLSQSETLSSWLSIVLLPRYLLTNHIAFVNSLCNYMYPYLLATLQEHPY